MTGVTLVEVPYHLGREGVGLGAGATTIAEALGGADVRVEREGDVMNEISASFDVVRALAREVHAVVAGGGVPLVVGGTCSSSLGTVAGLDRAEPLGVVWFDAHADFHTPETSETGFFDGMALAMLTGAGWEALRGTVDGLRPVREQDVVLTGARSIDRGEEDRLRGSGVIRAPVSELAERLGELATRQVYVHVDLDVLDPSEGRANWWAEDGGPSLDQVTGAIDEVGRRFEIRAAALTAYDPRYDPEGAVVGAATALADHLDAAMRARVP